MPNYDKKISLSIPRDLLEDLERVRKLQFPNASTSDMLRSILHAALEQESTLLETMPEHDPSERA